MTSASSTASATERTRRPSSSALARLFEPSLQADADVDAGVAQVERVGVALAAVTDDGDVLALDQGQVGVVVVEHLSHWGLSFWLVCRLTVIRSTATRRGHRDGSEAALGDRPRAAADGDHAGLHELADAEGLEHAQEVAELVGVAGHLDRDGVGGDVDDLGAEELDGVEHLRRGSGRRPSP